MAWLLGIRDAASIETHAARGALFETWVVSEWIKARFAKGEPADLYFWRDNVGHEVDLLFETEGRMQAVEIKSGTTLAADWLTAARKWKALAAEETHSPLLVFGGNGQYERQDCRILGWRELTAAVL